MSRITRRSIIPVNQITPLTYRDGVTYIQLLTELSDYIKTVLHPSLQHTVDQLVADVERQMDKHHDQYVDGVQEFQRIHDAFMSDVNASLVALNDTAVTDLVDDRTSNLSRSIQSMYRQEIVTHVSQFGAVGDGEHDDTQPILDAIDHAGDGPIALMEGGKHRVTDTIPVTNIQGRGATILVDENVNGLNVRPQSRASDFRVEIVYSGTYTHTALNLDATVHSSSDRWSVLATAYLNDIVLRGSGTDSGIAIGAHDNGQQGIITYLRMHNIYASNFEYGLRFITTQSSSWYTGNILHVNLYHMKYHGVFNHIFDYNTVSGNWQVGSETENVVMCGGNGNDFSQLQQWDGDSYPDAVQWTFTVDDQNGSYNILPVNRNNPAEDQIKHHSNASNSNLLLPHTGYVFPPIRGRVSFLNKRGTRFDLYRGHTGLQDDFLTYAHKNFTVTTNTGQNVNSLFTFTGNPLGFELKANEPLIITVDFSPSSITEINIVGILFGYTSIPDRVRIIARKTNGTSQTLLDVEEQIQAMTYTDNIVTGSTNQLVFEITTFTDRNLRIARLFASSNNFSQRSFIQANGGTVWGDIEFGEPRNGPIVQSPNGTRYRLEATDNGELNIRGL